MCYLKILDKKVLNNSLNYLLKFPEKRLSLSKSFQPKDKSPGVETLKRTTPHSTAIVYKPQFLLNYCCTITLYSLNKEVNVLHT